jgi:hypothetical protein
MGYCLDICIKTDVYKSRHSEFQTLYTHGLSVYNDTFQISIRDIFQASINKDILLLDEYVLFAFDAAISFKLKYEDTSQA